MPCLNVLMPSLSHFRFTGGPNTIFGLTYRLAARGVPVRYLPMDRTIPSDAGYFWRHLETLTGIKHEDVDAEIGWEPGGVYMATTWQTARIAEGSGRRFIYFIQDYEPILCRTKREADMAKKTYYLDFHAIVNESVLSDHLESIGNRVVFEPAVDADLFYPAPKKRLLVFYARPTRKRNLFDIGMKALRRVAGEGLLDGWTLRSIGSRQPDVQLSPGVLMKNVVWNRLKNYAAMMRKTSVALCLQASPHTGYPVMEVSACDGVGVTTVFQTKTRDRIQEYAPRSVAVGLTVDAVADGLRRAIDGEMSDAPLRGLAAKSWDEAFAPVLPRVEEMIREMS